MPVSTERMPVSTAEVIRGHLEAAREGVDAVMQHFTEESVLITREATYRGLAEIRKFYTAFFNQIPKGFFDGFKLNRLETVGEIGYIHWQVDPWFLLATDTFVVRNGKILFQTFAVYPGSK